MTFKFASSPQRCCRRRTQSCLGTEIRRQGRLPYSLHAGQARRLGPSQILAAVADAFKEAVIRRSGGAYFDQKFNASPCSGLEEVKLLELTPKGLLEHCCFKGAKQELLHSGQHDRVGHDSRGVSRLGHTAQVAPACEGSKTAPHPQLDSLRIMVGWVPWEVVGLLG